MQCVALRVGTCLVLNLSVVFVSFDLLGLRSLLCLHFSVHSEVCTLVLFYIDSNK